MCLVRTGTVNNLEFREPVKFQTEFLFIRNPDLLGNGRLPRKRHTADRIDSFGS